MKRKRERTSKNKKLTVFQDSSIAPFDKLHDDLIQAILTFLKVDRKSIDVMRLVSKKLKAAVDQYRTSSSYLQGEIWKIMSELGIVIDHETDIFRNFQKEQFQLLYDLLRSFKEWKNYVFLVEFDNTVQEFKHSFDHLEELIAFNLSKLKEQGWQNHLIINYITICKNEIDTQMKEVKKIFTVEELFKAVHQPKSQFFLPHDTFFSPKQQQSMHSEKIFVCKNSLEKLGLKDSDDQELNVMNNKLIDFFSNLDAEKVSYHQKWLLESRDVLFKAYRDYYDSNINKLKEILSFLTAFSERKFFIRPWSKKLIEFLCNDPQAFISLFAATAALLTKRLTPIGNLILGSNGGKVLDVIIDYELYKDQEKLIFLKKVLIQPIHRILGKEASHTRGNVRRYTHRHPRLLNTIIDLFLQRIQKGDYKDENDRLKDLQFYSSEMKVLTATLDVGWTFEELISFFKNNDKKSEWVLKIPEIMTYWSVDEVSRFYELQGTKKKRKSKKDDNPKKMDIIYEILRKFSHRYLIFKAFKTIDELILLQKTKFNDQLSVLEVLCRSDSSAISFWILNNQFTVNAVISYMQETEALQWLYSLANINEFLKLDPSLHPKNFNNDTVNLFNQILQPSNDDVIDKKMVLLLVGMPDLMKYLNVHNLTIVFISTLDDKQKTLIYRLLVCLSKYIEKYETIRNSPPLFLAELLNKFGHDNFNYILDQDPEVIGSILYEKSATTNRSFEEIECFFKNGLIRIFPMFKAFYRDAYPEGNIHVYFWFKELFKYLSPQLLMDLCHLKLPHVQEDLNYLSFIARCGMKLFSKIMQFWEESVSKTTLGNENKLKEFLIDCYDKSWVRTFFDYSLGPNIFARELLLIYLPLNFIDYLSEHSVDQKNMLKFLIDNLYIHEYLIGFLGLQTRQFDRTTDADKYTEVLTFFIQTVPDERYYQFIYLAKYYPMDYFLRLSPEQRQSLQKFLAAFENNLYSVTNYYYVLNKILNTAKSGDEFLKAIEEKTLTSVQKPEKAVYIPISNVEMETDEPLGKAEFKSR